MKISLKKTSSIIVLYYDTHHDSVTAEDFQLEKGTEVITLHFDIGNNLRSRNRTNATDDVEDFVDSKHAQLQKVQISDDTILKKLQRALSQWGANQDWKLNLVISTGKEFHYVVTEPEYDNLSLFLKVSPQ